MNTVLPLALFFIAVLAVALAQSVAAKLKERRR